MFNVKKSLLGLMALMTISGSMHGMEGVGLNDRRFQAPKPNIIEPISVTTFGLLASGVTLYSNSSATQADINPPQHADARHSDDPYVKMFQVQDSQPQNATDLTPEEIVCSRTGVYWNGVMTGFTLPIWVKSSYDSIKRYRRYKKAYDASLGLNIHGAAAHNYAVGVLKWTDQNKQNINARLYPEGRLPLHFAAAFGANDSLKALLAKMPTFDEFQEGGEERLIDAKDVINSRTAAVYAALGNHPSACKLLLKAGANGSIADAQGNTVYTIAQRNPELAQVLQEVRNEQRGAPVLEVVLDIHDEE